MRRLVRIAAMALAAPHTDLDRRGPVLRYWRCLFWLDYADGRSRVHALVQRLQAAGVHSEPGPDFPCAPMALAGRDPGTNHEGLVAIAHHECVAPLLGGVEALLPTAQASGVAVAQAALSLR